MMATSTSATISTKRAPRARKPAQVRKPVAAKAAPKMEATVEVRTKGAPKFAPKSVQLDPRTLVFASVGAGDLAFTRVREVSGKVVSIVRNPREMQDVSGKLSVDVTKVLEDLAARGEKLVGSVRRSSYTKRAIGQTKVARSQVKAASTSVRKAVDTTATAAREAVKKVS